MIQAEKIVQLQAHSAALYALAPGRKVNTLFSAGADKVVAEWNLETFETNPFAIRTEHTVYSLLNLNNTHLVIGTIHGSMHIIDLNSKQEIRHLKFHNAGVFHMIEIPNQNEVVAACSDGSISVWNENTEYWDRLSKTQILDLIKEYSLPKLSYCGKDYINYDWLRMCGHSLNDWTGKMEEFYEKTDEYEVLSPLYKLTDFINNHLVGTRLGEYKMTVKNMFLQGDYEDAFQYVVKTYNKLSKNPVGEEWFQNLHKRQETWYEFYEGNIHYVKKVA